MNTKNKIVAILMAGIVAMAIGVPMAMGSNEAQQSATVTTAATFDIRDQGDSVDVTSWTFTGAAGAVNETPVNSDNEAQDPTNEAKPIAIIKNTGGVNLKVYLTATTFTNSAATDEDYALQDAAPGAGGITTNLPFDTQTDTVVTIDAGASEKLWLDLTLGSAGKTGTSSFTVEGEAA